MSLSFPRNREQCGKGVESSFSKGRRRRSRTRRRVSARWAHTGRLGEERGGDSHVAAPPSLHPAAAAAQGCRAAVGNGCGSPRSRSAAVPRATWARLAARGAAAPGDGKVPGASAEMPGSDTALTVDRTYSDPGRHQRCRRRVSGRGWVALGRPAEGRGRAGFGSRVG